ncbi:MAG TPA: hypothetical protein VK828_15545 [Terriglobales bacterium]|jgi:hypothetical protein|nr:hypothetical protein [Terriglobales bacterium]
MTDVPKIVHDRLRAPALEENRKAAEPEHPDANLLAALAEQSLTATERDGVLEHLARCEDCRETVALAIPPEDVRALPTAADDEKDETVSIPSAKKPVPHKFFAWPSLRWAALAAGVAVVGSVLLFRPVKLNRPPASPEVASTAVPSTALRARSAGPPPMTTPSANERARAAANSDEANLVIETPLSKGASPRKFAAQPTLAPAPVQAGPDMPLARNKKSSQPAETLANMPGMLARDDSVAGETGRSATLTAEVSAAVTERNEAPAIEKAKPAMQGTAQVTQVNGSPATGVNQEQATAAAMPGLQAHATTSNAKLAMDANTTSAAAFAQHNFAWTISAGVLQRSLDGGQTWQDNLHAELALLCYARNDDEIWAGGQGGALYQSVDGGLTWIQLHPTSEGRQLTTDIGRIELRNLSIGVKSGNKDTQTPSEIVVSTSNKESWTSTDGGKSWKTK